VLCLRAADGVGDAAPRRGTLVIAFSREIFGARDALFLGLVAVAFEHQRRRASDVDFGYHGSRLSTIRGHPKKVGGRQPHQGRGLRSLVLDRVQELASLNAFISLDSDMERLIVRSRTA